MYKISSHPIIELPERKEVEFLYEGKVIKAQSGYTIAAALHQAGYPVHSHSLDGRKRSLECGIGKCGACEMLVDGRKRRICITLVDNIKEVREIPKEFFPEPKEDNIDTVRIYKTKVAIIGAGPAGLACREKLNEFGISNLVIDNNATIGGQFNMQTHQFFFFEKEKKYGGMRGFDIAKILAGDDISGILLNSTVWDILDGKRLAVKNIETEEVFYVDTEHLVVATGAIPFMPTFENDDLPGVYTAAVFQKMMNQEHTLLGKNVLTVGAGNIGYLTSYQGMQAGANIKAIIEAMPREGGFPVQANRLRRLAIPIMTSHVLLKAIPNEKSDGISGALIAECENFKPIPGTEKIIDDIDIINICTGLIPDNQLLNKGREMFGLNLYGIGDAIRIGEGTSAVLRGKQAAYEIAQNIGIRYNYNEYLEVSKQYIESQQHPVRVLEKPNIPTEERMKEKPFVVADCLYGFACNPCSFSCPMGAITKITTASCPTIDYSKCIGCMKCVNNCPGLAIFGYDMQKSYLTLPIEYLVEEGSEVYLVDNNGKILGDGILEKVIKKPNKTNVAHVKSLSLHDEALLDVRGFIVKDKYPKPIEFKPEKPVESETYVCHCEDVSLENLLKVIGDRKYISVDELKHITRLGMGPCRGKRCVPRAAQILRSHGVELIGDSTPRAPLSNQIALGDIYSEKRKEEIVIHSDKKLKKEFVPVLIAGGGIAGSSLLRYFSEAGIEALLINYDRGSTWRCIAGGRPAFSNPDISDIAMHNLEIFKSIDSVYDINFKPTRYVNLVHNEDTYKSLDASRAWSDAYMINKKDFRKEISPLWNINENIYSHALISNDCWQASPGRTVNFIRNVAMDKGGRVMEDCQLVSVSKENDKFKALLKNHYDEYIEITCDHFVNALGPEAEKFTDMLGIDTRLYPVKHQAFITRRQPNLGKDSNPLDMIIDRRHYKGFSAVYGQQLAHTGQIIACASPDCDAYETRQNLKYNTKEFLQIVSEVLSEWIPNFSSVGIHAVWSGYYVEPRYIIDTENGLFVGMRGHGFMLSQYLAKLYVDKYLGKEVPSYMNDLKLSGKGLSENAFK